MKVLAGLILSATVVLGQPVEATVFLPESLCGLGSIDYLVWNPANNQVYAATMRAGNVIALSAASGQKTARIPVGDYCGGLCVNPDLNKVYAYDDACQALAVIDGTTNTVTRQVYVPFEWPDESWLAYSPVRQKLYCLSYEGQLAVLDAVADSILRCLWVNDAENVGLLYNSAADKLYGLSGYGICIIDGATDTTRAFIELSDQGLMSMAVNDSSSKVYFLGSLLIAVVSGSEDSLQSLLELEGEPVGIGCNPVTNRVYAAYSWVEGTYEPGVVVLDGGPDTVLATVVLGSGPVAIVCDPAANRVYVGLDDGSVAVIDGATNQVVATILVGREPRFMCHAATEDALFASVSRQNDLAKIDCPGGSVSHVEDLGCWPGVIVYADEQDRLYVLDWWGGFLNILDGTTHRVRRSCALPFSYFSYLAGDEVMAYSRDLGRMYVALADSGLAVFDCATDSLRRIVNVTTRAVSCDPVTNKVYCAADYSLGVYDAVAETLCREIWDVPSTGAFCMNPARRLLYAGGYGTTRITVIDCAGDTIIDTLPTNSGHTQFEYSQAHDKVYARSDNNGELAIIDCATNQLRGSLRPRGNAIGGISLDEAGTRLFCSNWGGYGPAMLIDCATDSVIMVLDTIRDARSVWSHDSRRIYACGWYWGVLLIDAVHGEIVDSIRTGSWPRNVLLHPTQDRVYVTNPYNSSLSIIQDIPGVAEQPGLRTADERFRIPAVLRGRLLLPGKLPAVLFDASGRKALDLRAGVNDVSSVPSGIYFVRESPQASSHKPQAVQRVVLVR